MPSNPAEEFRQGVQFQARNQKPAAACCYFQARQLRPRFSKTAFNLSGLLQEMGQVEAATLGFRQALELNLANHLAL